MSTLPERRIVVNEEVTLDPCSLGVFRCRLLLFFGSTPPRNSRVLLDGSIVVMEWLPPRKRYYEAYESLRARDSESLVGLIPGSNLSLGIFRQRRLRSSLGPFYELDSHTFMC